MTRLKTGAKNKLKKALVRVERVILMDMRKNIDQQRKRKAKVMTSRTSATSKARSASEA